MFVLDDIFIHTNLTEHPLHIQTTNVAIVAMVAIPKQYVSRVKIW